MTDNPYAAPQKTSDFNDEAHGEISLERVSSMLRKTKPWVRFISVMTFIGSGLMVLGGLAMLGFASFGEVGGGAMFIGIIYISMALLYIIPGVFLWKYASRIKSFLEGGTTGELANALEAQKSFWKFVGVLILIVLSIYVCLFAFVVIGTLIAAIG